MSTYICELGCEEIPARFMENFLEELSNSATDLCTKHRLTFKSIETKGTYRRLTLIIKGLAEKQADKEEVIKGPPLRIAKDEEGNFLPPAIGFAKRSGQKPEALIIIQDKGQDCLAAKTFEKGKKTNKVLETLIPEIYQKLSLPIAMRWGDRQDHYFRPIHWILSIQDTKVIPFTLFGIKASHTSYGHRFLTQNPKRAHLASGAPIKIKSVNTYESQLEKAYILLDQDKRKSLIQKALTKTITQEAIDPNLLEEVTYLVEWPTIIKGEIDSDYLKLPQEVLIQCMKKHQKYFPVTEKKKLKPNFLVVADNVTKANRSNIKKGNENVLKARLEDVKFFYEEDTKTTLQQLAPKLENVVYQKGLGSLKDKVDRLQKLAKVIQKELQLDEHKTTIKQTIALCKADLVTQMVFELPDLQGIMGSLYAKFQGEEKDVVAGIKEHYYPRFSGDVIPKSPTGLVASLADKTDIIVASFYNGHIPTGSQDPWGVRRAMYGILRCIIEGKYTLSLKTLIENAYNNFDATHKNKDKLIEFFTQRIRSYYIENDRIDYDCADAVLSKSYDDPYATYLSAIELSKLRKTSKTKFKALAENAVRVARLAKKAKDGAKLSTKLFQEPQEKALYKAIESLKTPTLSQLTTLTPLIEAFFEHVLVMHKDTKVKENRLALITYCSDQFETIADFEKIVVS